MWNGSRVSCATNPGQRITGRRGCIDTGGDANDGCSSTDRADGRAGDLGAPSELGGALAQGHQADPGLHVLRDADAVVGDLDDEAPLAHLQPYDARGRVRVTDHVGDRLSGDAVRRDLDRGGQRPEVAGLHVDGEPVRRHGLGVLLESADQAAASRTPMT